MRVLTLEESLTLIAESSCPRLALTRSAEASRCAAVRHECPTTHARYDAAAFDEDVLHRDKVVKSSFNVVVLVTVIAHGHVCRKTEDGLPDMARGGLLRGTAHTFRRKWSSQ